MDKTTTAFIYLIAEQRKFDGDIPSADHYKELLSAISDVFPYTKKEILEAYNEGLKKRNQ